MQRSDRFVRPVAAGLCLIALVIFQPRALAHDTLYLKNGNQLSGESLGLEDGALLWKLPHGTRIIVPLDEVDRIEFPNAEGSTDPAASPLANGSDIQESPLPGPDLAAPEKTGGVEPAPEFADGMFGGLYQRAFKSATDWTERIELGARFLDGNSNEDFLNAASKFEQKTDRRQTQLEAGGQYGKAHGKLTTNRWFGNATIDCNRDGNWIIFVASKNEHDEFENLDYRGTLSSGLGYRFFNEDKRRMIVRLGPGVTYEDFDDPDNARTTPDAFGELEWNWPLTEWIQVEHKTTVNPSVEDLSVVRLNTNNGLLFQLDDDGKWSFKFGFRYDYNSRPNRGREPNDFTTSLLLVYSRK